MAIYFLTDGTKQEIQPVNGVKFTLKELQDLVDGFIQSVRLYNGMCLIINEEGKSRNLPKNEYVNLLPSVVLTLCADDYIVGNAVLLARKEWDLFNEVDDI